MNEDSGEKDRPIVFVSCGQYTEDERAVGRAIAEMITDETSAEGYFALSQTSLDGVSDHILKALDRCVGFVGIMHHRGTVSALDIPPFTRASVWIEQEIAIAAYLYHTQGRKIRVQLYIQDGIRLEGLRDKVMLNAVPFTSNTDVLEHFRRNVKSLFGTLRGPNAIDEPIRESPLGQKQFPAVFLTPQASNPDFILGATVRPFSYLKQRRFFDSRDEAFVAGLGSLSRGRTPETNLHEPLTLRRERDGVVLATPKPNEKRPDGAPMLPAQQIQVDSDGDVTIRFMQNENTPLFQFLAVIGVAYTFVNYLYPYLGLEARAHIHVILRLHAGRQRFAAPILPGYFDERTFLDLRGGTTFTEAFSDLTLQLFRASDYSSDREDVRKTLEQFAKESLPAQDTQIVTPRPI